MTDNPLDWLLQSADPDAETARQALDYWFGAVDWRGEGGQPLASTLDLVWPAWSTTDRNDLAQFLLSLLTTPRLRIVLIPADHKLAVWLDQWWAGSGWRDLDDASLALALDAVPGLQGWEYSEPNLAMLCEWLIPPEPLNHAGPAAAPLEYGDTAPVQEAPPLDSAPEEVAKEGYEAIAAEVIQQALDEHISLDEISLAIAEWIVNRPPERS